MTSPDACPICGTPWTEHDGPTRLCQRLAEVEAERDALKQSHAKMLSHFCPNHVPDSFNTGGCLACERDAMRAALEAVEWVTAGGNLEWCPWCDVHRTAEGSILDHLSKCPRQRALGIAP